MFMNQNLLSIITPVYQVEQYLPQCLDSILAQTYPHWELILVDDGSKDRSGEICEEYAKKDGRIRVIHTENRGAGAARNTGFAHATGEYVVFVDSDDYISENMIERLYMTIHKSKYDLVVCNFLRAYPDGKNDFTTQFPDMEISGREVLAHWKIQKNYGLWTVPWSKIIRKSILDQVKFPEGKYFEDEFFSDQLFLRCDRVRVIPDSLYVNRVRTSSTMNSQKTRNYLDLIDAFQARIELYLEQVLPVDEVYKILIFLLEPYAKCASAHLQGEDRRRLLQSREFIRKTAKILQKMDVSPMKKCSLPVIGLFPCATFRVAVKFRGLLEKYL